jgi:CheY-like chemotaxis protein
MVESVDQEDINSQLTGLISTKVLVVDDNAVNKKFPLLKLKPLGYQEAQAVDNGE